MSTTTRTKFGSVDRLPSGRFRARYRNPDTGEQIKVPGTFDTEKLARNQLKIVEAQFISRTWQDDRRRRVLFSTWATEYVENKQLSWKPGTRRNNRTLLKALVAEFGTKALGDITAWDIQAWWHRSADHPVNRRNLYFLLRPIMRAAVQAEMISLTPCQVPDAGKDASRRKKVFEVEDVMRLIKHASDEFKPVLWVMFGASIRIGELRGLNVSDYDAETGTLLVERQASDIGGTQLVSTKTGNTRRVALLGPARDALTAYLAEQRRRDDQPLFLSPKGGRITKAHFYREWKEARAAAGLDTMVPHDLRHVSATFTAQVPDVSLRDVMDRLGHSSVAAALRYQGMTNGRAAYVASAATTMLERRLSGTSAS